MPFPTRNLPNGDTFKYTDSDSGRVWVHDNSVWTPREHTKISDLKDVWTVGDTESSFTVLRSVPKEQIAPQPLPLGSCVMFQVVCGSDVKVSSVVMNGIYRDAGITNGTLGFYFSKSNLGLLGATDGFVDSTSFQNYFNTRSEINQSYSYTQIPSTSGSNATFSFYSGFTYNINTTIKAGEPIWIGFRSFGTTGGSFYFDAVPGSGFEINGTNLSGGPVNYSKLEWGKNSQASGSSYRWISNRPDHKAPYNLITRQTVDPTPADLTSHQSGTYWVNSTTGRVWVHAITGGGFEANPPDSKWIQFPVYNEHKVKPAVAQIRNTETDPYIVPPLKGEFMVDTSVNQLKLYDGTSWIVL